MVVRDGEFDFLKLFALNEDFTCEIVKKQFRSLWTAYCFHHGYDVDTFDYDIGIEDVWKSLEKNNTNPWKDNEKSSKACRELFQEFMCEEMI